MTATVDSSTSGQRGPTPELTIVIEWENVLLAEAGRALRMLVEVSRQVTELGRPTEALLVYDEGEVDRAVVDGALAASGLDRDPVLGVELVPVRDLHYYDLKNAGAVRARGDIIVFVDSDVVPEAGWLAALLGSFDQPGVDVVGSAPYIESSSLYEKMFALTWFFPLRTDDGPLRPSRQLFANSVAFRREVFAANPFPTGDGRARGACTTLSRALIAQGITVWRNPRAKVGHPAPNGLRHFVVRALYDGHDRALQLRTRYRGPWPVLLRGLAQNGAETLHGLYRIVRYRRHVDLGWAGAPAVMALSAGYSALRLTGYVVAAWRPEAISGRFSI